MYKLLIEWLRLKLDIPELNESYVCETCEALKLENANLRNEVNRLLDHILNPSRTEEVKVDISNLQPILSGRKNWNTERRRLEQIDAKKNDLMLKERALKAAGQKDPSTKEQTREEATTIAAPSNNETIGRAKSIEELEKDFTIEFPINDDQRKVN